MSAWVVTREFGTCSEALGIYSQRCYAVKFLLDEGFRADYSAMIKDKGDRWTNQDIKLKDVVCTISELEPWKNTNR